MCKIFNPVTGTGTPVGDPIEANSLGGFFGRDKGTDLPIYIGSVKTNIGHTESAAGTAGLIKILLMMEHKKIVPSLHLEKLNPKIDFAKYNIKVPTKPITWKTPSLGLRIGCVNSFGFGGTNSHAIVKEYKDSKQLHLKNVEAKRYIILLSAVDHLGLSLAFQQFVSDLQLTNYNIADISYTSLCRRDHFQYRRGVYALSIEDLTKNCTQVIESLKNEKQNIYKSPNIIAVFCGVGTTWQGMCCELLETQPIFKQTVVEIDILLYPFIDLSIKEIFEGRKSLDDPFIGHIAIFTCQVALWSLWKYWGLPVNFVVGQSVGEVAAAYASGHLTLEIAVQVIYHRSLALSNTKGGRMFVVSNCSTEGIANICKQYPEKACIAVYSSLSSCTVSCDEDVIDEIKQIITIYANENSSQALFKDLNVKVAYHSFHTSQAGLEVENALRDIQLQEPQIPMISTVTGQVVPFGTQLNAEYWKLNVQNTVLFKQAIKTAGEKGKYNIFLEIGPKPVLHAHLSDSFKVDEACCTPSMNSRTDFRIEASVIELFEKGVNLDWTRIYQTSGSLVNIPRYKFNGYKRLFEPESRILRSQGVVNPGSSSHLFVSSADINGHKFNVTLDPTITSFAYEHFVSGEILVPGALYVEVALEIGRILFKTIPHDVEVAVQFLRPFALSEGKTEIARVIVDKSEDSYKGEICTGNIINSTFTIKSKSVSNCPSFINPQDIRKRCKDYQNSETTYKTLAELGFSYGEYLQVLGDVWKNDNECLVEIKSSHIDWDEVTKTHFHPVLLDGLIQMLGIFESGAIGRTIIPCGVEKVVLHSYPEKSMLGYGQVVQRNQSFIAYNMFLISADGRVIAEVQNCESKFVGEKSDVLSEFAYDLLWRPATVNETRNIYDVNSSHIFVIAFDDATLNELNTVFEGSHFQSVLAQSRSLDVLKELFKSVLMCDNHVVCLFPGKQIKNYSEGTEVLDAIQMSCVTILALLQTADELGQDIPYYIFTEMTQGTQTNNMIGAAIWGQIRCAMWENPLNIRLVDLQSSLLEARSFISDLVLKNIIVDDTHEMMFKNGKVFINNLHLLQDFHTSRTLRLATFDDKCEIDVHSSDSLDIKYPFGIAKVDNKHKYKNSSLIKIETACIHHKDICPVVINNPGKGFDIITKDRELGYKIVSLEMVGVEMSDGYERSPSEMLKPNRQIIACYPTELCSVVSVPTSCVIDKSVLPWYKPGVVFLSVLMFTLVNHIEENKVVIVLHDDSTRFQAQVLELMLLTFKNSKVKLVDYCNTEFELEDNMIFVLMIWLNSKWCDAFVEQKNTQIDIVTLSCYVNKSITQWLNFNMSRSKLTIIETTQAAGKRNFLSTVPKVLKWLRQNLSKVSLDKCTVDSANILGIPTNTMSLKESVLSDIPLKASRHCPFRNNGCYVVVGGLTGLGWEIVKLLAEMEAGIVAIYSRRIVSSAQQQKINDLSNKTGCKIYTFSTDITDMKSLRNTFDKLGRLTNFPIKGIFNGAGVLMDCLFQKMNSSHFESVLRPKVLGTWNLHQISQSLPLDYFIMHSSISSVFGNQGQTNYGAANAFMDGLARYRQSIGLCGQSINWGPLAVGMAATDKTVQNSLKTFGYNPLNISDIKTCFLNCLNSSQSQITIGSFDWNKIESSLSDSFVGKRFMLIFERMKNSNLESSNNRLVHVKGLSFENEIERLDFINNLVLDAVQSAFAIEKETVSKDTNLSDLGIDSMQAMTFVNTIHERINIRLPFVVLLTAQTTIETITNILDQELSTQNHSSPTLKVDVDNSVFWSMTPMEKYRHDMYLKDPKSLGLITVFDLDVAPRLANEYMWKSALHKVHKKHSGLRTLFIPSDGNIRYGFKRRILHANEVEIDFQIVEMSCLLPIEPHRNETEYYHFDPSKNIPMRTLYASTTNRCLVRFVFNNLCTDLSSLFTILKDLKLYMTANDETVVKDEEMEKDEKDEDLAAIFETCVLQEKESLKSYWKSALASLHPIEHLTFSGASKEEIPPGNMISESITLPHDLAYNLDRYLKVEGVKLFDFITTMYELLLRTKLNVPVICIDTAVDLRLHFPEMREHVCRFTNRIPLIAVFENAKISLKEFLRTNSKNILKAVDKSLLPSNDIWKLNPGLNEINIRRHLLIIEDISLLSQFESDDKESFVRLKNIYTPVYYYETALRAWWNRSNKTLKLELSFSPSHIRNQQATQLLTEMLEIIEMMIYKPDTHVLDLMLQNAIKGNTIPVVCKNILTKGIAAETFHAPVVQENGLRNRPKTERLIQTAIFMKQTSRGWDHEVYLSAQTPDSNSRSESWNLTWGPNKNKTTRTLSFSQIQGTDLIAMNGYYCLRIRTEKRHFTFKTRYRQLAIEWMQLFKQGLH